MTAPQSKNEFNNWTSLQQKAFIDYETAGHHHPNTAGIITYRNFTIEYVRGGNGKLKKFHIK